MCIFSLGNNSMHAPMGCSRFDHIYEYANKINFMKSATHFRSLM